MYMNAEQISQLIKPLADATAAELGEGWTVQPMHANSEFPPVWTLRNGPQYLSLHIPNHDQAKITISGSIPNPDPAINWTVGSGDSIHVSVSRGPKAIAAEIKRRLLPSYLVSLEKGIKRRAEATEYRDRVQSNKQAMLAAFGLTERKHDSPESFYLPSSNRPGYGDCQVSGDSVTLKLCSIPPAMALRIADIYMGRA